MQILRQPSTILPLLLTCLITALSLSPGVSNAQEQPKAAPDAPAAQAPQTTEPANRLNWPSAWTSEVLGKSGDTNAAPGSETSGAGQAAAPVAAGSPPTVGTPVAPAGAAGAANGDAPAAQPSDQQAPAQQPVQATPNQQPPVVQAPIELKVQVAQDVEAAKSVMTRLETVTKTVERLSERSEELTTLLPTIEKIITEANAIGTRLKPSLADVRTQIEKLGPPPTDGKQEANEIATERTALNAVAAEIDGAIKSTELSEVRGRQLIARIQVIRLDNFRSALSARSKSILAPSIWQDAFAAVPSAGKQLTSVGIEWWRRAQDRLSGLASFVGLAGFVWLVFQIASRRIRVKMRETASGGSIPTFSQRTIVAGLEAVLRMLPKIVFAAIIYFGVHSLDLLYLQIGGLADAVLKAVIIASAGLAYTTAYLQPSRPVWRVIDIGDPAAKQARLSIRFAIALFALDVIVRQAISELTLPLHVNILWTSLVSLAFALIFISAARIKLAVPESSNARLALLGGHVHKIPLLLSATAIVVSVLTGYVALGHFIATRLLILSAAIFLLVIFYFANRAISREPDDAPSVPVGSAGIGGLPLDIRRKLARGLSIFLDGILFLISIPVLLIAFGFSSPEITTLLNQAVFGFVIGGVEISLFQVGLAVALFAGILFATRMLQRWLGDTILNPSRTEQGLGNSIRTGVGYLGFIIAAIAGLSYAGLDITNLAIVAGALSVGIGFGLQSIVNNFVSGLILLVERPINVGDWIKVGELQGHVRKISVRSTEIETFERASVIIPNSELISGTVVNLTLRNALGRITIPIGVSYASDPEQVQKLLQEAASECELVSRYPAPVVVFENFGASSLDFSLRIFVSDVSNSLAAQTQVRKAIFSKFREAGVDIPFPQQDLNVRDIDGLKTVLTQFLERQQNNGGGAA